MEKEQDISQKDLQQQIDLISTSMDNFCSQLEQQGIAADVIAQALLASFSQVASSIGDRAFYDELLLAALEEEWEQYYLH